MNNCVNERMKTREIIAKKGEQRGFRNKHYKKQILERKRRRSKKYKNKAEPIKRKSSACVVTGTLP